MCSEQTWGHCAAPGCRAGVPRRGAGVPRWGAQRGVFPLPFPCALSCALCCWGVLCPHTRVLEFSQCCPVRE